MYAHCGGDSIKYYMYAVCECAYSIHMHTYAYICAQPTLHTDLLCLECGHTKLISLYFTAIPDASDSRLEAEGRDRCCFNPRSDFGSMPLQDDACYTAAGNEDVLDEELFQLGCQTEFACRKLEKRVLRLRRVER